MRECIGQEENGKERQGGEWEGDTGRGQTLWGHVSAYSFRSNLMVTRRPRGLIRSYTSHLHVKTNPLAAVWLMERGGWNRG